MFKKSLILLTVALVILAGIFWLKLFSPEDSWICENNQWIMHGNPSAPKPNEPCGEKMTSDFSEPATTTSPTTNIATPSSTHIIDVVPNEIKIDGLYVCLPKIGDGPQTQECALGIMSDDGKYYSLDTNRLGKNIDFATGDRLHIEGIFTPIEMISSNLGRIYNVKGIITALKVEELDQ
jgi:hypothetical protein